MKRSPAQLARGASRELVQQMWWRPQLGAFGYRSELTSPRLLTRPRLIRIGSQTRIRVGARLEVVSDTGSLMIEDRVSISDYAHIGAADQLTIGCDTTMGSFVTILDHDHGIPAGLTSVMLEPLTIAPVSIGRGVWIGEKATVLKGVTVGDGSVIGAHAVVTRDVPERTIVGGVPARVIGTR